MHRIFCFKYVHNIIKTFRGVSMSRIILSTESGADLPYKITIPNLIEIVPMHITFGKKTLNDGCFDISEIDNYFKENKKLPKTSAVNPKEYIRHFRAVFQKYKDCKIIHISYSSTLSTSYQNAVIASTEFESDRLCIINSLNGSIGTGTLVMKACEIVCKYSAEITFEECISLIKQQRSMMRCLFLPEKLDYLKAGGRISGIAHLGASVLNLKPTIDVKKDGTLSAGKKYRGDFSKVVFSAMDDFVLHNNLNRDFIIIGYAYAIGKPLLFALKRHAHRLGFKKSWCFQLGSAVTSHTGPLCIGYAGVSEYI